MQSNSKLKDLWLWSCWGIVNWSCRTRHNEYESVLAFNNFDKKVYPRRYFFFYLIFFVFVLLLSVCLFVCLFVCCLLACLFVSSFVCLFVLFCFVLFCFVFLMWAFKIVLLTYLHTLLQKLVNSEMFWQFQFISCLTSGS